MIAGPQTLSTRYSFGEEHNARVTYTVAGVEHRVSPVDISKGHICLAVSNKFDVEQDQEIEDVSLEVMGHVFELGTLALFKINNSIDSELLHLVYHSKGDLETNRQLWLASYLLRENPSESADHSYDKASLPKVPARGLYTEDARQERLGFIREQCDVQLEEVSSLNLDPTSLVSNIEALVGSVEIPVGIAGPLHIKGVEGDGLYYAPMATSEGALVASATRGATAISRSGGAIARVLDQRMLRVPVFVLNSSANAVLFSEWVTDHFKEIAEETRKYSNYANLVKLQAFVFGRSVHVHFVYKTGDAAGQNMTTTCTWRACQWILSEMTSFQGVEFENFMIEANLSNDKKVTYQSFLRGRGIRVLAEAQISDEVCQEILKVTAKQLVEAYNNFVVGSVAAGMVGININIANVIGAMFAATGQDIACTHESSIGQLHLELTDAGDVYATMMLPSLVVGTVGGGTNLPTQRECLELLGCAGPGNAEKLAEIIASFCLALDLSTLSAIASDQFARAHEKLGRNRPVDWLKLGDLDEAFFNRVMREHFVDSPVEVKAINHRQIESTGSSIITELTAHKVNKLVGHFPVDVVLVDQESPVEVMVKVKPLDTEVILMLNSMASMCDARLASAYDKFKNDLGFQGCHTRELAVMSSDDARFTKHAPIVYGVWEDKAREAYVIVEERLDPTKMVLMDSADDTSGWEPKHIHAALDGIAEVHSIWYGREEELAEQSFIIDPPNQFNVQKKIILWEHLGAHAREEFPEWFTERDMQLYRHNVYSIPEWYAELDKHPKTLTHNDFNPRNIAFREGKDGELTLCAYDWELATMQLPQHDLAELLIFTLQPDFKYDDVLGYIEYHRAALSKMIGEEIDREQWHRGYALSLSDLIINRIPQYVMAHTFRHYDFMDRVVPTFRRLLAIEAKRAQ
ncbi:MAG: phosphotransferase [Pseudomonadales bacterium]|nr:phosphotransferase [Pseudomonadales bacterium]